MTHQNFSRCRAWTEINLDNLVFNYKQTKQKAGNRTILCVIKADAYGHGAVQIAKALSEAGAERFAVATPEEAMQLRRHDITQPILLFGAVHSYWIPTLAKADITLTVSDLASAQEYAAILGNHRQKIHLKIDTGMNRIGINLDMAIEQTLSIAALQCFEVEGIFTHFASADNPLEDAFTMQQYARFQQIVSGLDERGLTSLMCHCANSAATISHSYTHADMVRAGIMLYGCNPCGEPDFSLKPVLSLHAAIVRVSAIKKGESVGYGRTWHAPDDAVIATLPIGYADGLFRNLSGKLSVLVNGEKAPLVGSICMDMCMLDVTHLPHVHKGDVVTLIGQDGESSVTAEEVAAIANTIPYEILCAVGKRIPRVYLRGNHIVEEICYIDQL